MKSSVKVLFGFTLSAILLTFGGIGYIKDLDNFGWFIFCALIVFGFTITTDEG